MEPRAPASPAAPSPVPLPRRSLALADAPARPQPYSAARWADCCPGVTEADAHAWLDGELDVTAADAVARHLAACAGCRAFVGGLAAFLGAVRRDAPGHGVRAPERLRARVRALAARGGPSGALSGAPPDPRAGPGA